MESLIIISILITFPILVYEFYTIYIQNMKMEKRDILFSITILISFYIAFYYKQNISTNYHFVILLIPILLALYKKKTIESIILTLILTEHSINTLHYNPLLTILAFTILYITYFYYLRSNKSQTFLANSSIIIIILLIILENINNITNSLFITTILKPIIFYLISSTIIYKAIYMSKDIISLHTNLKEFEKEKNIKLSLFKITHEIKNPIAVIKGYLDMFDTSNIEKSNKYIDIIQSEIERTLNLLDDFLLFSKIKVEKETFDFNYLIDEVKDILIPFFKHKNVNYNFEIEKNLIINMDYKRMKQVIINIIKNAVEACPNSKGHVSTTVFKDSEALYIYVKDNGIGMNKETLENIMQPFYTTKEKGTGLGVSLSKEIIEAHNGNINYTSSPNNGTVCKITLPLN